MAKEIVMKVVLTVVGFITTGALGYLTAKVNDYRKKLKSLEETQLMDMRNDLSNKFFVYDSLPEVEDYLVMGFREKSEKYFELGGDSWIHPMYDKSFKWKIKPTGYLN